MNQTVRPGLQRASSTFYYLTYKKHVLLDERGDHANEVEKERNEIEAQLDKGLPLPRGQFSENVCRLQLVSSLSYPHHMVGHQDAIEGQGQELKGDQEERGEEGVKGHLGQLILDDDR